MYAQEFSADWPAVLDDVLEFISLTQLAFGRGRAPRVVLSISRERVAADALQPHIGRFRDQFARLLPEARLEIGAARAPAHRVEVHYHRS